MTPRRRRWLELAALIAAVLVVNALLGQSWHVTAANLALGFAIGAGFGLGSVAAPELIRLHRKDKP